jgi:hypothetical protein
MMGGQAGHSRYAKKEDRLGRIEVSARRKQPLRGGSGAP